MTQLVSNISTGRRYAMFARQFRTSAFIENRVITKRLAIHLAAVKTLYFLTQTAFNMVRLSENQRTVSLQLLPTWRRRHWRH